MTELSERSERTMGAAVRTNAGTERNEGLA